MAAGALLRYFGHGTEFGFTGDYSLKWFQSLCYVAAAAFYIPAAKKLMTAFSGGGQMTQIADEIVHLLAPVIGNSMASSAVSVQCRRMGIEPGNLSKEKIDEFAERFQMPLQIFAGDSMAREIMSRIKKIK